jgi:hypothetical protein
MVIFHSHVSFPEGSQVDSTALKCHRGIAPEDLRLSLGVAQVAPHHLGGIPKPPHFLGVSRLTEKLDVKYPLVNIQKAIENGHL